MSLMSPYELKMKLDLADDRSRFVKEHSLSDTMKNAIVTDDGHMHFFDDEGNDITKSVKSIEKYEFSWCKSLTNVIIPDSVTSIGEDAFYNCSSLTSIVIPKSVKSIRDYAFSGCKSLKSISIPDSVKSIGKWTFSWCTNLKRIVFKGKTLEDVKSMDYYPWGADKSIIKAEKKA